MFSSSREDSFVCGACRKSYPGPGPLKLHQRTCQIGKKRLRGALEKAKEIWERKKKPRLEPTASLVVHEPGPSAQLMGDHLEVQVGCFK
jgi:hypothetical protein